VAKKDDAEEAVFDPSQKRLNQLRRDGQVPRSQEFTGAVTLIALILYLLIAKDNILDLFRITFRDMPIYDQIPFWDRAGQSFRMMGDILTRLLAPVILLTIGSSLLATILDVKGFMFTLKPLTPNIAKFNPAEGLKNLFTLKNLIDLIKSLIKIVILFWIIYFIIKRHLNDIFWAPTCGLTCVIYVLLKLTAWIVAIGVILLIVAAAVDLLITRWLFTRDNRMTLTEMKRENKEDQGSPEVRGARNQERRRLSQSAGLTGPQVANLFLRSPNGVVGITYKPDVSGVPIVALKGRDQQALEFLEIARQRSVGIVDNTELTDILLQLGRVGEPIPRDTFTTVARALVQAGFKG
jgi:type III secretion protein U